METPRDLDMVLQRLLRDIQASGSTLSADDESYLNALVNAVRAGRKAIIIVEEEDERLRYMFTAATRSEAVTMLGKVVEVLGRRMANGDD